MADMQGFSTKIHLSEKEILLQYCLDFVYFSVQLFWKLQNKS